VRSVLRLSLSVWQAHAAQARLAAANLRAGPRDTVVGVRRKVS
jgi:hypothetical protein